uniref:Uncharacterized protein n=1 Tax=Lactuca sativa TaxID=4236 RepID=A0A9R1WWN4_LACSA|nr:hypothetical protein LSAT_V11C900470410 [Lactuca sativa]
MYVCSALHNVGAWPNGKQDGNCIMIHIIAFIRVKERLQKRVVVNFLTRLNPINLYNRKMALLRYMDTILVPLSFFITFGYHTYLWYKFKTKPSCTTIGIESIKRKHWLKDMKQASITFFCFKK